MNSKLFSINSGGGGGSISLPVSIGNGGTGQTTATLAFNALNPMTTLGDIIYHDGTNAVRKPSFTVTDDGNSGTSDTIDWSGYKLCHKSTLTGNVTYTFTAPDVIGSPLVLMVFTGAGSFTVTWPATVKWASNQGTPVVTTTASRMDLFNFVYDGTNYYGSYIQTFTP